jgi:hypothetical protein
LIFVILVLTKMSESDRKWEGQKVREEKGKPGKGKK